MICRIFFALIFITTSSGAFAQYSNIQSRYWKTQRHTIGFGVGVTNFLGELGGRDKEGSDFIYDMEWSQTKPSLQVNYRYQLGKKFYAKAQFSFGFIGGDDALTKETFRRNRNLHFKSTVMELSAMLEFDVINFTSGSKYDRVSAAQKRGSSIYVTGGIGFSKFNPKANFDGEWYKLKDMGTEGQGQIDGPSDYSLFTVVVPFGLGYRYQLNREWTIGAEIVHRITFTDYIDDVSTVYYDNDIIFQSNGELAAYFADPSRGYFIDDNGVERSLESSTATGEQRGDPDDNDAYFMVSINAYYKLPQKRKRGRGRTVKRRRRRVLF